MGGGGGLSFYNNSHWRRLVSPGATAITTHTLFPFFPPVVSLVFLSFRLRSSFFPCFIGGRRYIASPLPDDDLAPLTSGKIIPREQSGASITRDAPFVEYRSLSRYFYTPMNTVWAQNIGTTLRRV